MASAPKKKSATFATLRARKAWSVVELAVHADVAVNTVRAVEEGEHVNTRTLLAVGATLGLQPERTFALWLASHADRKE